MVAVLEANGSGFRPINLQTCPKIEGEIERAGIVHENGMGGIDIPAVADEKWLQFAARKKVTLQAGRRHGFADGPTAPLAEAGFCSAIRNAAETCVAIRHRVRCAEDRGSVPERSGRRIRSRLGDHSAAQRVAFERHRNQFAIVLPIHNTVEEQTAAVGDANLQQPALLSIAQQDMAGIVRVCRKDSEGIEPAVGGILRKGADLGQGGGCAQGKEWNGKKAEKTENARQEPILTFRQSWPFLTRGLNCA